MGALVLGLVLVIGYFYQRSHPIRRIELARSTSYHIYFKAGFSGFVLLTISVFIWMILDYYDSPSFVFEKYLKQNNKLTFISDQNNWNELKATAIFFIMFLAAFSYSIFSYLYYWVRKGKKIEKIQKVAHELERLVISSTLSVSPVRVELESEKVYVGIPKNPDLETGELKYIVLIPLLSGYIDDKKAIIFSNNYYRHYENNLNNEEATSEDGHKDISDFQVTIPVEQIVVASRFSIDAFIKFREDDSSALIGSPKPATK